jgi:ribose transport system ATP-binding protein
MTSAVESSDPPILAVNQIEKRFLGVHALRRVSFGCYKGEIHALVGENGAGKSTLMRILSGAIQPDSGQILVRGRPVHLASPRQARDLGIAMVYQDTRLVGELDVVQNIWLERTEGFFLNFADLRRRTAEILAQLGVQLDLRARVDDLSLSHRQVVEIARALTTEPAVLILDEPTTALEPDEVRILAQILRGLRQAGTSIIFISHRLQEVLQLADRVSVLKDGSLIETLPNQELEQETLVRLMVGRQLSLAFPPKTAETGQDRLVAQDFASPGNFAELSFRIAAGQIVGLGGIQGNGQREILRALFGVLPSRGTVLVDDTPLPRGSPGAALRAGVVYVPGDRRREGLFLPHSIRKNISAPHLRLFSRLGILKAGIERRAAQQTVDQLKIRTPSPDQPVRLLSGGNQQKVVFGRWMLGEPKVYLFEEPTQGVDVGTKLELYRILRELTSHGAGILLLSTDLLELIGLCDEILVVAQGQIVDRVPGTEATEERVVGSAVSTSATGNAGPVRADRADSENPRNSTTRPWLRRYAGALLLLALIIGLAAFTTANSRYFLTERNLSNLLIQVAPLVFVAIGQTAAILIGGIDLTVGPLISLTTGLASYFLVTPGSIVSGSLICLASGLLVGALNGFIIVRLGIPDLIATLATYSVVTGLALTVRPSPGGSVSEVFADFISSKIGWMPIVGLAAILFSLFGDVLLVRARIGTRLYALGSNAEAAYIAGVPTRRLRFQAYLFSGLMAAIAGLIISARIGSGDPQAGAQFTLASVTAVVVGGTSIFGGRGNLLGTLLGAFFVILMQNALNQLHVTAYYQYVWTGALLLFAVGIYSWQTKM